MSWPFFSFVFLYIIFILFSEEEKSLRKKKRPILMDVTRSPQALRRRPMLLAVTPLPRPLTTPPVTNTYFIFFLFSFFWEKHQKQNPSAYTSQSQFPRTLKQRLTITVFIHIHSKTTNLVRQQKRDRDVVKQRYLVVALKVKSKRCKDHEMRISEPDFYFFFLWYYSYCFVFFAVNRGWGGSKDKKKRDRGGRKQISKKEGRRK